MTRGAGMAPVGLQPARDAGRAPGVPRAPARWPEIDWSRPWFAPYRELGAALYERVRAGLPVAEALDAGRAGAGVELRAGALRFVPQEALPPGVAYEAHIAATACVPTRDNLHDFFNGLVWWTFPAWKRRLNELQAEQIAALGIGARRGPVRDALTLFDENGALLAAAPDLVEDLRERRWQRLFVEQRGRWQAEARLVVFGHALLEKLVAPWKSVTAHVWWNRRERSRRGPTARSGCRRRGWRASRSCPCRCWACRAGGRPTRTRAFTTTRRSFVRGPARRRRWRDNACDEVSQTAAGARAERPRWRKVRTAQGSVAGNTCPP